MSITENLKHYIPPQNLLQDKVIAITGASGGIGAALSLACAKHGATVVLMGRTEKKLERIYDKIEELNLAQPAIVPFDLNQLDEPFAKEVASLIDKEFGRLDGLVHNAATAGMNKPVEQLKLEDWQTVLNTNLTAPFLLSRWLIPLLKRSEDAKLLFTLDRIAEHGCAFQGAYSASKMGVKNLMLTLAAELEHTHIRVNGIDPGPTRTELRAQAYPGEQPKTQPTPEEGIHKYLFMLGKDSNPLHGETILF